jgi:hypothetical protein
MTNKKPRNPLLSKKTIRLVYFVWWSIKVKYIICVCLRILVSNTYCVVFFYFVCLRLVSCVPNVASFSRLFIVLIVPSVYSNVYLWRKYFYFSIFYWTHNFSSHRNCGIVALMVLGWSANIRKLAKNYKGYGSAAQELIACLKTVSILVEILILL